MLTSVIALVASGLPPEWGTPLWFWEESTFLERIVILTLAIMAISCVFILTSRSLRFAQVRRETKKLPNELQSLVGQDKFDEALRLTVAGQESHVSRVLYEGLSVFSSWPIVASGGEAAAAAERAMHRRQRLVFAKLSVGLNTLSNIALTAPGFGIGGTIVGFFTSFGRSEGDRVSGMGVMASGFGHALAFTAVGLAISIAATCLYNHLQLRVERLDMEISSAISQIASLLSRLPPTAASSDDFKTSPSAENWEAAYDRQWTLLIPILPVTFIFALLLIPAAFSALANSIAYRVIHGSPASAYNEPRMVWELPWGLLHQWRAASLMASGIYILLGWMFVQALCVVVYMALRVHRERRQSRRFAPEMARLLKEDSVKQLASLAKSFPRSHAALTVSEGLRAYEASPTDSTLAERAAAVERSMRLFRARLDADIGVGLKTLATITSTAFFIGIGGTVLGVLYAFRGSTGPREQQIMRLGIELSAAILGAVVGLGVAIAAKVSHDILGRRLEQLRLDTALAESQLLSHLLVNSEVPALGPENSSGATAEGEYRPVSWDQLVGLKVLVWGYGLLALYFLIGPR